MLLFVQNSFLTNNECLKMVGFQSMKKTCIQVCNSDGSRASNPSPLKKYGKRFEKLKICGIRVPTGNFQYQIWANLHKYFPWP